MLHILFAVVCDGFPCSPSELHGKRLLCRQKVTFSVISGLRDWDIEKTFKRLGKSLQSSQHNAPVAEPDKKVVVRCKIYADLVSCGHRGCKALPAVVSEKSSGTGLFYGLQTICRFCCKRAATDCRIFCAVRDGSVQRKVLRRKAGQLGLAFGHAQQGIVFITTAVVFRRYDSLFFTEDHAWVSGLAAVRAVFTGGCNVRPANWFFEHGKYPLHWIGSRSDCASYYIHFCTRCKARQSWPHSSRHDANSSTMQGSGRRGSAMTRLSRLL